MTKEIQLTQGKIALVDDEDFEYLNQWKWHLSNGYAVRNSGKWPKQKHIFMHRDIVNTPNGMDTDHKDMNRLNKQRDNLRVCTRAENRHNQGIPKNSNNKYKGICWTGTGWKAQIKVNGKKIHLSVHKNKEDAARAYDQAATKHFGEFAKTNF